MRTLAAFFFLSLASNAGFAIEYERALLPIATTDRLVPGQFGSSWQTTFTMHNGTGGEVLIGYLRRICTRISPCSHGKLLLPGQTWVREMSEGLLLDGPGSLIWYDKTAASDVYFNLRVQDISRAASTWGTEVPVVREAEFRTGRLSLLNVPTDPRFRTMLRVYGLDKRGGTAHVRFYAISNDCCDPSPLLREITLPLSITGASLPDPSDSPDYAELGDVADVFPELRNAASLRIDVEMPDGELFWAFVTVTNDETQHVTVISPE